MAGAAFGGGALLLSPEKIDPLLQQAAIDHGIDPRQLKRIIHG